MKRNRIKLFIVLLFFVLPTALHAQSNLFVRNKSGTQIKYELNSIKKITFSTDQLTINQNSASTNNYELSEIRSLNFIHYATENQSINNFEGSNFILYPNPVIDQIQISYELKKPGNMLIEITDLPGKVLYQKTVYNQIMKNHITISAEQLPMGIYICRIQNDDQVEIIKFLKK